MLKLLLCLLLPAALYAQPAAPADSARARRLAAARPVLDKIYADYAARNHLPGLAYGLVVDGRLVYANALGYSNLAAKTPASPRTVYRIASMTKSFVALAVLRLRDEGRLRLDDPAAKYLPELQSHPPAGLDAPPLTIRQLLSHAAGLPEDNPWGDRQLGRADRDLDALVRRGLPLAPGPRRSLPVQQPGLRAAGPPHRPGDGPAVPDVRQRADYQALGYEPHLLGLPAGAARAARRWLPARRRRVAARAAAAGRRGLGRARRAADDSGGLRQVPGVHGRGLAGAAGPRRGAGAAQLGARGPAALGV